jgi:hypothetical protein
MRAKIGMLAGMVLVLTFACVVQAQFGMMKPPELRGVFNPVMGEGASYHIVNEKGTQQFDIAVVDKESGGYWMEYSMRDPKGETIYVKSLLVKQGDELFQQRALVQVAGQPPMDMSAMMQRQNKEGHKLDIRAEAQKLGTETVTTPAGTFSCDHWRTTKDNADVWMSDKVTPWGLVKMTSKSSGTVTLTKVITGAKTHITGTPVSLEEMMKQKMGKQ